MLRYRSPIQTTECDSRFNLSDPKLLFYGEGPSRLLPETGDQVNFRGAKIHGDSVMSVIGGDEQQDNGGQQSLEERQQAN
jgi:hypothetical protein